MAEGIYIVAGLVGGVALFLYGVDVMAVGFRQAFGSRVRKQLNEYGKNPFLGIFIGIIATVVFESSTATTVMLVGLTKAGIMSLKSAMGIIMGANIGTTLTVQFISFDISFYAFLFLGAGVLFYFSSRGKLKIFGEALIGVGLIFLGMYIMTDSVAPLKGKVWFKNIILGLKNPIYGILVGAVLTILLESSGAFLGLVIALSKQGLVPLDVAIGLIFGANLGTCLTAVVASIGGVQEAKRIAAFHVLFNVIGVLIFLPFFREFEEIVILFSRYVEHTDSVARQIANAHTLFNVSTTLFLIPFIGILERFTKILFPDKRVYKHKQKFVEYIMAYNPFYSLNKAFREVLLFLKDVYALFPLLENFDYSSRKRFLADFQIIYDKYKSIEEYLLLLGKEKLSIDQIEDLYFYQALLDKGYNIAYILKNEFYSLKVEMLEAGLSLSKTGEKEINTLLKFLGRNLKRFIKAMDSRDMDMLRSIYRNVEKFYDFEMLLRKRHFGRIREGILESEETDYYHLRLLEGLYIINFYLGTLLNLARRYMKRSFYG